MKDYRRRCMACGELFDYREAMDADRVICPACYCEDEDFNADELGLDPEEEYDA